jgi:methylmalonyl-CoA decarboxylase subunit alpha
MQDFHEPRERARAMGGPERLARRASQGRLNARERVDRLVDDGSFLEVGTFNTSDMPGMEAVTPADSKIAGFGTIDRRPVAVCSNDFTVLAATSSRVASDKEAEVKAAAIRRGVPIVYLSEAGGARMPDMMGAAGIASFGNSTSYERRRRKVPMVTAVLYSLWPADWNACLSDFVVMLTGASMAVSGPRVLQLATGERVSPEELGGVKVHAEETGFAAHAAVPVVHAVSRAADAAPVRTARRRRHGDHRGCRAGGSQPCLRHDTNRAPAVRQRRDPRGQAALRTHDRDRARPRPGPRRRLPCEPADAPRGAPATPTGATRLSRSSRCATPSNVSLVFLEALALVSVPRISVIVRKAYGQAYINKGGGYADLLVAWPTAEMSFMDPETGVNVVHGAELASLPSLPRRARRQELVREWELITLPYGAAARHLVDEVIDPAHTRDVITRSLGLWDARGGIGRHRLASWPTSTSSVARPPDAPFEAPSLLARRWQRTAPEGGPSC